MKLFFCVTCCLCVLPATYCSAQDYYVQPVASLQRIIFQSFAGYTQRATYNKNLINTSGEPTLQYAFNSGNSLNLVFPVLYNGSKKSFGLSDIRLRYTSVLINNISRHFVALEGSLQVIAPSGDRKLGLGSDRSIIQPTFTGIFSFPGECLVIPYISYIHYINHYAKSPVPSSVDGYSAACYFQLLLKKRVYFSASASFNYVNPNTQIKNYIGNQLGLIYQVKKFRANIGWGPNIIAKTYSANAGIIFFWYNN